MNWYLIVVLLFLVSGHLLMFYKSAKNDTATEASVTAVILAIFWWLFYMAGILTLL